MHARRTWLPVALLAAVATIASAQDLETRACTVSVLNRVAAVHETGHWQVYDVPAGTGMVRARLTCVEDGRVLLGTSPYFDVEPDIVNGAPQVRDLVAAPVPVRLELVAPATVLNAAVRDTQLSLTAHYSDGSRRVVTSRESGTTWRTSNPRIATVTPGGLLSAVAAGRCFAVALHEGLVATKSILVASGDDSDLDGIPDAWEIANGLNPFDPADSAQDRDGDGLANLGEYLNGTLLGDADTDDDHVTDGEEVAQGTDGYSTDPLSKDTDGDGVPDRAEVLTGTNPTNPASRNPAAALSALAVSPADFALVTNRVDVTGPSRDLAATGTFIDGVQLEVTSHCSWASLDPVVAIAGPQPGHVEPGTPGLTEVTASFGARIGRATARVAFFTPGITSTVELPLPGYATDVALGPRHAYVSLGSSGLVVVDIADLSSPVIGTLIDTPGNANDVALDGSLLAVADGTSGVAFYSLADPATPAWLGTLDTLGVAKAVALEGSRAFVADGANGLVIVDASNPRSPALQGSVNTPGDANGVDVEGSLVVVADGASGLVVINAMNPSSPVIAGSRTLGFSTGAPATDVALEGTRAYVAAGSAATTGGMAVVSVANPAAPVVLGRTVEDGSELTINLFGIGDGTGTYAAADQYQRNLLLWLRVSDLGVPNVAWSTFYPAYPEARFDTATGVAADIERTATVLRNDDSPASRDDGTTDDSVLALARHRVLSDTGGRAPAVFLRDAGRSVVAGLPVTLVADATDDVMVHGVRFVIDGLPAGADFEAPFTLDVVAPAVGADMRVRLEALDLAGSVGVHESLLHGVAATAPTIEISYPAEGEALLAGSIWSFLAQVTATAPGMRTVEFYVDGELSWVEAGPTDGQFRFDQAQYPLAGSAVLMARVTDGAGQQAWSGERHVRIAADNRPPYDVRLSSPRAGGPVSTGCDLDISASASDLGFTERVELLVDGEVVASCLESCSRNWRVPPTATSFVVQARGSDPSGNVALSPPVTVSATPRVPTTLSGLVLLPTLFPASGADVAARDDAAAATGITGSFTIPARPADCGPLLATASLDTGGVVLRGASAPATPVAGGVTALDPIVLRAPATRAVVMAAKVKLGHVVNLETGTVESSFAVPGEPSDVVVTPDGRTALVMLVGRTDNPLQPLSKVAFVDLTVTPPQVGTVLDLQSRADDLEMACNPNCFALGAVMFDDTRRVEIIDVGARAIADTYVPPHDVYSVAIAADASYVLIAGKRTVGIDRFGTVRKLLLSPTGQITDPGVLVDLPVDVAPRDVEIRPDGQRALIANFPGQFMHEISLAGGVLTYVTAHPSPVSGQRARDVAWTADGRRAHVAIEWGDIGALDFDAAGSRLAAGNDGQPVLAEVPDRGQGDPLVSDAGGARVIVHGFQAHGRVLVIDPVLRTIVRTIVLPSEYDYGGGGLALLP